jgi:hypothetical protein
MAPLGLNIENPKEYKFKKSKWVLGLYTPKLWYLGLPHLPSRHYSNIYFKQVWEPQFDNPLCP